MLAVTGVGEELPAGASPRSDAYCLRLRWPTPVAPELRENVMLGAWHPAARLRVTYEPPPSGIEPATVRADNWFLLSNTSAYHDPGGLVHQTQDADLALAFRGYLLQPSLHAFSPAGQLLDYWRNNLRARHNGVFSAAVLQRSTPGLTLLCDAFGMSPLYYRRWNELVLFASNPRYLALRDDEPDHLAWRSLLQTGFMASDRTLARDVQRVPAGTAIEFSARGMSHRTWFDIREFPAGTRAVVDGSLQEVEDRFRTAMARSLALSRDSVLLPLSSGHDSRRILGDLIATGTGFHAITVRGRQKGFRDLDGRYAAEMARDFGFPHQMIEPGSATEHVADDVARRLLLDGESGAHSWAVSMMRALPQRPCLVLDGILGDILGNPGFRMAGMYRSTAEDLRLILQECVTDAFDRTLSTRRFPGSDRVKADISDYLRPYMGRINMAEYAFILLRQRRSTALWSQQLLPVGHVLVCPYMDLDYIELMFEFIPADKHRVVFQRECLRRFQPKLFRYPGNRDIPPDLPPGDAAPEVARNLACVQQLRDELEDLGATRALLDLLSSRGRTVHRLGGLSRGVLRGYGWLLQPLMELVVRQARSVDVWELAPPVDRPHSRVPAAAPGE